MQRSDEQCYPTPYRKRPSICLLWGYYLATPLFLVFELVWDISIRVPFFFTVESYRYLYYAVCFVFGVVCFFVPKITPFVALVESSVNIVLLIVGYVTIMLDTTMSAGELATVPAELTLKGVMSFALTGVIWITAFYHSQSAISEMIREEIQL